VGLLAALLLASSLGFTSFLTDLVTSFQLTAGDALPFAPAFVWSEEVWNDDDDDNDDDEIGKCSALSSSLPTGPAGRSAVAAGLMVRAEALVGAPKGARCPWFLACGRLVC
jgi:hypothetical protein